MAILQEQLDALKAARASGELRVSYDGRSVEYRSIAELTAAIAAVQAEIDDAAATPPARVIRTYAGRGT